MKNILLIEPFYKGSHQYWADNICKLSQHNIDLQTKNGVFWKWRIQQSTFAFPLEENHNYDFILSTNMVNLAAWAGINRNKLNGAKLIHYYHENQLNYPAPETEDIRFFGFIDITSAICADHLVFNSNYHMNSFLDEIDRLSKKLPDRIPATIRNELREKSSVLPIGLNSEKFLIHEKEYSNQVPLILWNHRWEYDKNPKLFFETLYKLKEENIPFELAMIGKAPRVIDPIFHEAKERLAKNIIQWGSVETFEEYAQLLWRADILPVTSDHDFFGISVLEAALCKTHLFLPIKNAYPEHFDPKEYPNNYYDNPEELYTKLKQCLVEKVNFDDKIMQKAKLYSWENIISKFDNYFNNI